MRLKNMHKLASKMSDLAPEKILAAILEMNSIIKDQKQLNCLQSQ